MASISLCMIVKNESSILKRCLDSVADLMDEIIIVDTGSTDTTKEIAGQYTDKIFDFTWCDDFSAARNFAFSKATMDYIYSADADEVLDEENRLAFAKLKAALFDEIEIVQMNYREQGVQTVLNAKTELRPKLFKRQRSFTWIDPIHETVRTEPVVFDSEIIIDHKPVGNHSQRDFSIFEKAYDKDKILSERILAMYAKELFKWGEEEKLKKGAAIFLDLLERDAMPEDLIIEAYCIIAKAELRKDDREGFMKYIMKVIASAPCAEACFLLGEYYSRQGDSEEAEIWYHNAASETVPIMDAYIVEAAKEKLS